MDKRYGITNTISGLLGHTGNGSESPCPSIVTTRERVSPRIAQDWLNRHNDRNRRIRASHVVTLARAMEHDRWLENGVPIAFSESGRLLDGQHRLHAVIKSGRAQWFSIVRGLPDSAYDTFDQGSVRTTADLLDARGEVSTPTLAAAARLLLIYRQTGHFGELRPAPSRDEIIRHVAAEPELRESIAIAKPWQQQLRVMAPSLFTVLYHLCAEKSIEDATHFFGCWATGLGFTGPDDPIYILRQRFDRDALLQQQIARLRDIQAALVFRAWNAARTGQRMKLLRWNPSNNEPFPTPQ